MIIINKLIATIDKCVAHLEKTLLISSSIGVQWLKDSVIVQIQAPIAALINDPCNYCFSSSSIPKLFLQH